jgi:MoaA/NifB/PqqE/SkfB family radical SAM enzyme
VKDARLAIRYARRRWALRAAKTFPIAQEGLVYHCPLDRRRRGNLALQRINLALLERGEPSLPHIVHVGVTTICNLRCPACPTGTRALGRPSQHLDYEVYARMVDDLRGCLMFALFWDWGEPLLHPRIADMVRHATRRRIKTVISTNGTGGNSLRRLEALVDAGLDVIIVCIDGADQATYERYRRGGRLSDALTTIERLTEARCRQGAKLVIEFRTLANRYNEAQLPQLLGMAEASGCDVFSVKSLRPYDYRGHDVDGELVPLDAGLARYGYGGAGERRATSRIQPQGRLRCGKPLYAPTLNSDGTLAFCSYVRYEEEIFGPVDDVGFRRLWRARASREKRLHFQRAGGTRSCETCYFRTGHKPTILYTVPLRDLPEDISLERSTRREAFLDVVESERFPSQSG